MRKTDIVWTCPSCLNEFELFADDGAFDKVICWNWCPHCKEKVDVWIRFKYNENEEVPLGLTKEQAHNSG